VVEPGFPTSTQYLDFLFCSFQHKKWEGDGILITKGRTASLKDLEGKEIAKSSGYKSSELECLQEGNTLCVGGKEIEARMFYSLIK